MGPPAKIHLDHGADTDPLGDVDEQAQVDPVTGDEVKLLQQRPPSGVLTGEGLGEAGQVGEQAGQKRAGDEFGHSSTLTRLPVEITPVPGLDEIDRGVSQQRCQETGDERGLETEDVGVTPHHQVAGRRGQRGP